MRENDVRLQCNQIFREHLILICFARPKTDVDVDVATRRPSELLDPLQESGKARLYVRLVLSGGQQHANAPHPLTLLRARRERPRDRTAEQRDELTARYHSITSSASASTCGGMSRRNALATTRLMISSNLVVWATGRSAGFSPLRMRPV